MNLYVWYIPDLKEWRVANRPPLEPGIPVLMLALPPGTDLVPIDWGTNNRGTNTAMKIPTLSPQVDTVEKSTPMIMKVTHSHLLWVINRQLESEGKKRIPLDTVITCPVPGGGDWSNTELELDNDQQVLLFRWRQ